MIETPAVGADEPSGEGVGPPRGGWVAVMSGVAGQDLLCFLEGIPADDGRVVVSDMVPGQFAPVGIHAGTLVVGFICLLEQHVPAVAFQPEDLFDVPGGPAFIQRGIQDACGGLFHPGTFGLDGGSWRRDLVAVQAPCDLYEAVSLDGFAEDAADDGGLFFHDLDPAEAIAAVHGLDGVCPFLVSVAVEGDVFRLPTGVSAAEAGRDARGDAPALFLGDRAEDGQHQVILCDGGVEMFFFKGDRHMVFLQDIQNFQKIAGISRKSGDGFCDDVIDPAFGTVAEQALEPDAAFPGCAGDPPVRVDTGGDPQGIVAEQP